MSFTSGDACHFGSPIFTIHVLPKALLTKVVELKNRVLPRPKLEEKSVEFFSIRTVWRIHNDRRGRNNYFIFPTCPIC